MLVSIYHIYICINLVVFLVLNKMASTRVLSRLLVPKNLHRLSTIGANQGPVRQFWHHHHHHRRELPVISNVIERWEKEFDRMQEQFNNFFQNMKTDRVVPSANKNLLVTESDGSKKFHLSFNVHGFDPEEIKIKTHNGTITISARKENKVTLFFFLLSLQFSSSPFRRQIPMPYKNSHKHIPYPKASNSMI